MPETVQKAPDARRDEDVTATALDEPSPERAMDGIAFGGIVLEVRWRERSQEQRSRWGLIDGRNKVLDFVWH
jgi:hypothetical protein